MSNAASRIAPIVEWLIAGAPPARLPNEVLQFLGDKMAAAGFNVDRAGAFVTTLHPNILGRSFIWRRGEQVVIGEAPITMETTERWVNTPVIQIITTGRTIRARLDQPATPEFPIYSDLRAEGMTDYLGQPIEFTNGERHAISWATKRSGGFTSDDIEAMEAVRNPLARVAEVYALRRTATNLLDTYVGHSAGARILSGQIRRGDTETIFAAIWLADLRGFTALADSLPGDKLIALLNEYFECLVAPILDSGGEVLKFMGDGLLAIFPTTAERGEAEVCRESFAAARETRLLMKKLNLRRVEAGEPILQFGLALHVGEVLYGNIGGASRLDFTAIGPTVNMASRLEALAGRMGRNLVLSAAVARHLGDGLVPLGRHELRGFRTAEDIYGLADEQPAGASA